jgi:putative colanic acid biosynthesis glycosyltransferase
MLSTERPILVHSSHNFVRQLFLCEGEDRKGEGGLRINGCFKHSYNKETKRFFEGDYDGRLDKSLALGLDEEDGELPLITIITVVRNGENFLEETIQSVINQTYPNLEYIVVDGASSDRTLDIIRKYEHAIDYWVSEKDQGIYDAMNKGVNLANGNWVYFLGGDDRLADDSVVSTVFESLFPDLNQLLLVFGCVITDSGKIIKSRLDSKILLHNTLHHQSCFYSRRIFDDFRYDASLNVISDYEVNLIAFMRDYPYIKVSPIIAMCRDGGVSTSKSSFSMYISETNVIRKRHVGAALQSLLKYVFFIKSVIHYALRYI